MARTALTDSVLAPPFRAGSFRLCLEAHSLSTLPQFGEQDFERCSGPGQMILQSHVGCATEMVRLGVACLGGHALGGLISRLLVRLGRFPLRSRGNWAVIELFFGLEPILQIGAGFASAFLPNVVR
jgi:hypothetical protein